MKLESLRVSCDVGALERPFVASVAHPRVTRTAPISSLPDSNERCGCVRSPWPGGWFAVRVNGSESPTIYLP